MAIIKGSRIGSILAGLALFLLILGVFGAGYEQIARRRDKERFPQVGVSIDVGGRTLNLFCSGQGSPAVVLESDAAAPGYSWLVVQRDLAKTTKACWYDRAGYGWSDPAPAPHAGTASARDLHSLLRAAGIAPPYLLVGDGFGGFNVRIYASLYPTEVGGVALVNPVDEETERLGVAGRIPFHLGYPPELVLRTAGDLGLMRLMPHGRPQPQLPAGWSSSEWSMLAGLTRQPKVHAAFLAEQGFVTAMEGARATGSLGDRPLVVMASADPDGSSETIDTAESRLAHLSTRGKVVTVTGRGRNLQYNAPEAVTAAVVDILTQIRGSSAGN